MKFKRRDPIIFLVAGKARSGKSTVGNIIYDEYINNNKKVIVSPITKYLKKYIEEITDVKMDETNKPRELLQKLSSVVIKGELGMSDFFIDRMVEDLKVYSYFFDVIVIPDVRFKEEIEVVKNNFKNAILIGVERINYESELSEKEKNDITEISLDNYNGYDYKIINDGSDLKYEVDRILRNYKE